MNFYLAVVSSSVPDKKTATQSYITKNWNQIIRMFENAPTPLSHEFVVVGQMGEDYL